MSDKNFFQSLATDGGATVENGHQGLNFLDVQRAGVAAANDAGKGLVHEAPHALGTVGSAAQHLDVRSLIGELSETEVIGGHKTLVDIAERVAGAKDASPAVTKTLSAMIETMRPSVVTYENLASVGWQATTQGKMMQLGRVLAADGWEAEAATVLRLMPK